MTTQIASITTEPDPTPKTKLCQKFAFWYRIADDSLLQPKQQLNQNEYETQVKKIAEFETIEDFWAIFQHLRKPDSCKPGIEFQMFKDPVKPMWEDEYNKQGGKISIKLRKDFTTIIWEEMIFALISGVLPKQVKDEINGVVVSSRKECNVLQIWFKTFSNAITSEIEQCLRDLLQIPEEVALEVKQFYRQKKEFQMKRMNAGAGNNKDNKEKGKEKESK